MLNGIAVMANQTSDLDSFPSTSINLENINQNAGKDANIQFKVEYKIQSSEKASTKEPIKFDLHGLTKRFMGREKELEDIHSKLQAEPGEGEIIRTVAIVGMGGIGKTQLTRKYAEKYEEKYKHIVWINAENKENLAASFTRLHDIMPKDSSHKNKEDIRYYLDYLYKFLGEDETALLIFDNVERFHDIKTFLPRNRRHRISTLISSRYRKWHIPELGEVKVLELKGFSEVDASNYVKENLKEENDNDVSELFKELQGFPLGLKIAVNYIINEDCYRQRYRGSKFKIADYLAEYKNRPETLLDTIDENDMYEKTITTTLDVTMQKIRDDKLPTEDVLHILTYFDPTIDLESFIRAFRKCFQKHTEDEVSKAVEKLRSYSMIDIEKGYSRDYISVHRLVQHTTRIFFRNENEEEKVLDKALDILLHYDDNDQIELQATMVWSHAVSYDDLIKRHYSHATYGIQNLSPVHLFVKYQNDALKKIVKEDNIDVNLLTKDKYYTPLELAIESGYLEGVELLSNNGIVLNNLIRKILFGVSYAVAIYEIPSELLFNRLISVDKLYYIKDGYKNITSRIFKFYHSKVSLLQNSKTDEDEYLLLDNLFNSSQEFYKAFTKRRRNSNIAMYKNYGVEIHEWNLWLESKKKIEINLFSQPRLNLAVENGHLHLVKHLIGQGEDPREFDDEGQTAVHTATRYRKLTILKYFIDEMKIDVNIKNSVGGTPLHAAVEFFIYSFDVIEYLVKKGAEIEAEDDLGLTAIFYTFDKNDLASYFLNLGVKLTCSSNSLLGKLGITLPKFAILEENMHLLKMLMKKQSSVYELYSRQCLFGKNSQFFENKIGLIFNDKNALLNIQDSIKISSLVVKHNLMTDVFTYDKREYRQDQIRHQSICKSDIIYNYRFVRKIVLFVKNKERILRYIKERNMENNGQEYWNRILNDSNVKFKIGTSCDFYDPIDDSVEYNSFHKSSGNLEYQPSLPVPNFVGRQDKLEEIHDHLQKGRNVVVLGEAGVGKSELIRRYAQMHKDFYKHIIWLNASTRAGLLTVFNDIHRKNNFKNGQYLTQLIKNVHRHFRSIENTLYIFDNTVDYSKIEDFIPKCGSRVIFNSRNRNWDESGFIESAIIRLKNFSEEEAFLYVLDRIPILENPEKIKQLVNILECHPLALQHAVGYMKHSPEFGIHKYIQKFNECEPTNSWHKGDSYNANCIKTWKIIFDSIEKSFKDYEKFKELIYELHETESELGNIEPHHQENFDLIKRYSSIKAFMEITKIFLRETDEEESLLKRLLEFYKTLCQNKNPSFIYKTYDIWNRIFNYPHLVKECFKEIHINVVFHLMINSIINCHSVQLKKLFELCKMYKYWVFSTDYILKYSFSLFEEFNFLEGIQMLINLRPTSDFKENLNTNNSMLHFAAANDNKEMVIFLKAKGHRMDVEGDLKMTPVMLAAYFGNVEIVEILTENQQLRLMARLYSAVNDNDEESFINILQQFKNDNPSLNLDFIFDLTILYNVYIENEDQIMTLALVDNTSYKESLNGILTNSTHTLLHAAALDDKLDAVKSLIENGHKPNETDHYKNTAMHYASLNGSLQLVEFLMMEQDFKSDVKNLFGITPLHMAALSGHIEIVKFLIENGANFKAVDAIGATPELYAAFGDNLEIVKFFHSYKHTAGFNLKTIGNVFSNIFTQKTNDESQSAKEPISLLQSLNFSLLHVALVFNSLGLAEIAMKSHRKMLCEEINFIPCFVEIFNSEDVFRLLVKKGFATNKRFSLNEIDEFMKRFKLDPEHVSLFLHSKLYLLDLFDFLKKQNNKSEQYYSSLNIVENFVRNIS